MKIIGLNGSPNQDGLTASMLREALEGAAAAGAEVEVVHMKARHLEACRQCGNGWGTCIKERTCVIEDDFQALREALREADATVWSIPVYFWEVSEVAKNFLDRLRRCEFAWDGETALAHKPLLGIAAAGGSGRGTVGCLQVMERYAQHLQLEIFDWITVTRYTREYKLATARAAGEALARWKPEG